MVIVTFLSGTVCFKKILPGVFYSTNTARLTSVAVKLALPLKVVIAYILYSLYKLLSSELQNQKESKTLRKDIEKEYLYTPLHIYLK